MTNTGEFPDVELALVDHLSALGYESGTLSPKDLLAKLPFVRVNRIGGRADALTDTARLAVDVYATSADRSGADHARTIRGIILSATVLADRLIVDTAERAREEVAPNEVPSDNSSTRRWTAVYALGYRRH